MAIRKIRTNPDPVLREKAKKVTSFDSSIQRLINDMVDTLDAASGIGLAANQIGVPLRIIVIQIPDEDTIILVNPEIIEKKGERLVVEGCLSIPGYQAEIKRANSVKIKARNREGKPFRLIARELKAQALEHEIDHLNGVLYIDYLEDESHLKKMEPG
jgi:peptide deformylase